MAQEFAKFFTLEEFLESSVAKQKSNQNCPSWEVVLRLRNLAQFLDWLREDWGSGIRITSGFRNAALNKAVNGVATSCHQLGYAADIQPVNGKMEEFKKFVVEWAKDKLFDQIIIERNKKTEWIHISQFNSQGQQRRQIFKLTA